MLRSLLCTTAFLASSGLSSSNTACGAELSKNHQSPIASYPTTALTAAQLQLYQYFYADFPRALQAIDNQTQLAEGELALFARRVNGYRPFRSFHQYAATYTVDQEWQLAYLAAQQRLQCLRNAQIDLWRQRQAVAAVYMASATVVQ